MRIFASFRIAARALRRNKMRSVLTMLGIIIGVGSVIAAVSITTGATKQVEDKVTSMGLNVITIYSGNFTSGAMRGGWGSAPTLTLDDAAAIQNEVTGVIGVSPEVRDREQILANGLNWNTQTLGESPDFAQIRNWEISAGTMFSDQDVRTLAKVAVVGKTVTDQLFPDVNPLGQTLRIRDIPFKVVGLLAPKGFNLWGQDQDDRLIVPYTTAMKRVTGDKYPRSVTLQISASDRINVAQQQIVALLRQRHRLTDGREDDFNLLNQKEIADTVGNISTVITLCLGSIASMSLVVGGIGIMNIMLVSVTERTREIGIRMAVGAQAYDILLQFLIEAITLSLIGGVIGVLTGISASRLASMFAGFTAVVSPGSVILAFTVSFAIGVFFGFYPARKAASLDPIEALRYE